MPSDEIVLDLLLGTKAKDEKNNAILKTSFTSVMGGDDIILSGVAWKRRSGFGKYSTTIGVGPSWEQRHFILTSTKLTYFAVNESTSRGTLNILPERATITATYPGDTSQPTPYALSIRTTELGQESTKWKLCFEDRKTHLAWLIAITDIVSNGSVKEYNAKVLAAEKGSWGGGHDGFHRLYEEGSGNLFQHLHQAIMTPNDNDGIKPSQPVEHVKSNVLTPQKFRNAIEKFPESTQTTSDLPMDKLYQVLTGINISFVYLMATQEFASTLAFSWWQVLILVNAFIVYTFLSPTEKSPGKQPTNSVSISFRREAMQKQTSATKSAVGAQLLRAESVPLSPMPSSIPTKEVPSNENEQQESKPLSEKDMDVNLHERWAQSAPDVDLSGSWTLIADDEFKKEYDTYLTDLGFNRITRGVACSLIARTTEITKQSNNGRELYLEGINPKGAWKRTLASSGFPDFDTRSNSGDYTHMKTSIKTADAEEVDAEAWWETRGTKHRSILRGGKKGDYESLRYLESSDVLVCESIFHPRDSSKKKAEVKWRFQRVP